MQNPFEDLIPKQNSSNSENVSSGNPFEDLIPKGAQSNRPEKSQRKLSAFLKDRLSPDAPGELGREADTITSSIENTGMPNAARAFFQGGTNSTGNLLNFISDLTGNPAPRFGKVDFGADYNPEGNALTAPLKGAAALGADLAGGGAALIGPLGVGRAIAGESMPLMGKIGDAVESAYQSMPRLAEGLNKAKNALMGVPGAQKTANILSSPIAQNVLTSSFLGASQFPDNRLGGAALGGLGSAAIEGAPIAAKNAIQSMVRPRATQEEVQNVLNALPLELQNQVPLGEMIKSSPMTSIQQNVLSNIPLSGMSKPYEMLNTHIKNEGQNIMDSLLGGSSPQNIQKDVYNAVKGNYEDVVGRTNNAYESFRDAAKASNAPLDTSILENSINKKISDLNEDLVRNPRRNDQYQPILQALNDYKNTLPKVKNFDDLERMRVDLNKDKDIANGAQNFEFSRNLKSLVKDVDNTMDKSVEGNEGLKGMLQEARDLYKQQIPFRESINQRGKETPTTFFNNYLNEKAGKSTNLDNFINENIKTGKNDSVDTLNNLMKILPDDKSRNLVAAHYLGNVYDNGVLNPEKLTAAYSKLGDNQKALLFPRMKDRFDKLQTLSKTYPDMFKIDFNPKTGQKTAKILPYGFEGGLGIGGYAAGGLPGAIASLAGLPIAGYAGRKLVTSPSVRNALMNKTPLVNPQTTNALQKLYLSSLASAGEG